MPNQMTTTLSFCWSDGPSTAVIAAVASELDLDSDELTAPLHDFVDPDALDTLFSPTYDGVPRANGLVTFSMHGCSVTVDGSGEVIAERVTGPPAGSSQSDESQTLG